MLHSSWETHVSKQSNQTKASRGIRSGVFCRDCHLGCCELLFIAHFVLPSSPLFIFFHSAAPSPFFTAFPSSGFDVPAVTSFPSLAHPLLPSLQVSTFAVTIRSSSWWVGFWMWFRLRTPSPSFPCRLTVSPFLFCLFYL